MVRFKNAPDLMRSGLTPGFVQRALDDVDWDIGVEASKSLRVGQTAMPQELYDDLLTSLSIVYGSRLRHQSHAALVRQVRGAWDMALRRAREALLVSSLPRPVRGGAQRWPPLRRFAARRLRFARGRRSGSVFLSRNLRRTGYYPAQVIAGRYSFKKVC